MMINRLVFLHQKKLLEMPKAMYRFAPSLILSIMLVACQSASNKGVSGSNTSNQPFPDIETIEQQEIEILQADASTLVASEQDPITLRLLEQGQAALQRDDLLTPKESNANMYFQAVLGREPDNEIAQKGLQDIVARYTKWALTSTRNGQHGKAKQYMDSATFVNPKDPQIQATKKRITELRQQKKTKKIGFYGNKYYLPSNLLKSKDEVVLRHLQPIIDRVEQNQSRITIYWPNDREARYLYQIINSRIDSFRVRGMIHLRKDHVIEIEAN
ncbi:hypothetical protein CBF23_010980 [Marinomonas agarivorans]|nr:hypothetical protein CBF23_010980 [Marinomonas agarivorans]